MEVLRADEAEVGQRKVAGALAASGLEPGDRVLLVVPSGPDLLVAVLGALRSGVVPVVLSPALLRHERDVLAADAEPALVVDDARALARLLDGPEADIGPVPRARPMLYTSGTTGRPKGVWSGLLADDAARALVEEERSLWGFDAGDVHLVCSPLHHSAPIRFATGTLLAGGAVAVLDRFTADRFAAAAEGIRPTTTFMVPTHLQRVVGSGEAARRRDLAGFRLVAHAGAPCPAPLKRAAMAAFPSGSVWEFYGATEGQFTACSPGEWEDRPGTVGRARPGRRLTVDDDGTIWCEAPQHAHFEYWRDPAATASAWRGQSFTVGDVGRLDAEGYLWLDGRADDLVITGGLNVHPAEVEHALVGCPGVADVAVFGVPDDRWGQRVVAAIVGDADPADVLAHARARLAAYKCPKEVLVVAELPRSNGKLRRSRLPADLGLTDQPDRPA